LGPFDTNEDGGMLKNTRKTNSSFNNSWISRLFYRCLMHENLKGDGEKMRVLVYRENRMMES
jgi:hypothetical protein